MNPVESVLVTYPKAKDCLWGHVGTPVYTTETLMEDDKVTVTKVKRCGWCDMVLEADDGQSS